MTTRSLPERAPTRQEATLSTCILCGERQVAEFLDLGRTALANKFLRADELTAPEPTYPLRVGFCHGCGHVQLTAAVPPADMFDDYLYVSSASDTLRAHFDELADTLVRRHGLRGSDLVMDIGCNDGALLGSFRSRGVRTLGVDPARNLAELTRSSGIERYVGFFGSETVSEIVRRWGRAHLITATNTFPHIPDLADFVRGIDTALAPGGTFVIEAHYLVDLLEQGAFDTIYHEHVSYWAVGPLVRLFASQGLQVVDVERLPIHHGQIRVSVQRRAEAEIQPSVAQLLQLEHERGIGRFDTYAGFAQTTLRIKRELRETLGALRSRGRRVVGYGAPAKGNTLLGFLDIDSTLVEYIADRSPLKQGRFTPGCHIPVVPAERLLEDQPDYVLLLAWNFRDEILRQQAEYRRRGGKFIVPLPRVQVI